MDGLRQLEECDTTAREAHPSGGEGRDERHISESSRGVRWDPGRDGGKKTRNLREVERENGKRDVHVHTQ